MSVKELQIFYGKYFTLYKVNNFVFICLALLEKNSQNNRRKCDVLIQPTASKHHTHTLNTHLKWVALFCWKCKSLPHWAAVPSDTKLSQGGTCAWNRPIYLFWPLLPFFLFYTHQSLFSLIPLTSLHPFFTRLPFLIPGKQHLLLSALPSMTSQPLCYSPLPCNAYAFSLLLS